MYRLIVIYKNGILVDMIEYYYNNTIALGKRYCNNADVESVKIINIHSGITVAKGGQGILIDTLFGETL